MALTASSISQVGWTQTQTNSGFQSSQQGPDSLSALMSYTSADEIFVEQRTLTGASTHNYDLTSMTNLFNESFAFSKIMGIQIVVSDGTIQVFGALSAPYQWPNVDLPTDVSRIELQNGSCFFWGNSNLANAGTVDVSHKNIFIQEMSGVDPATYKIVLIGKKV
jgi:hypothetical protein